METQLQVHKYTQVPFCVSDHFAVYVRPNEGLFHCWAKIGLKSIMIFFKTIIMWILCLESISISFYWTQIP